jgi:hypothetical protein
MKNALITTVILSTLIISSSANAASVFGGSNLNFLGYPEHSCSAPWSKPYQPVSFTSQWEVDSYNGEVDQYNSEMSEYIECIQEYVDNASNDMERVKQGADAAIREANSQ